jgi:hypothetical protein
MFFHGCLQSWRKNKIFLVSSNNFSFFGASGLGRRPSKPQEHSTDHPLSRTVSLTTPLPFVMSAHIAVTRRPTMNVSLAHEASTIHSLRDTLISHTIRSFIPLLTYPYHSSIQTRRQSRVRKARSGRQSIPRARRTTKAMSPTASAACSLRFCLAPGRLQ